MRSYNHAYDRTKPPASDFPLFLDRDSGGGRDEIGPQHVEHHRAKRLTAIEKFRMAMISESKTDQDAERHVLSHL